MPVLAPGKHKYVNFGSVPNSDMYRIQIQVGFGYKCSQSVSKQKKNVFLFWVWPRYIHDTAGYIPDTGEERKGKKCGKQRDLGRNKYCQRSLEVVTGHCRSRLPSPRWLPAPASLSFSPFVSFISFVFLLILNFFLFLSYLPWLK